MPVPSKLGPQHPQFGQRVVTGESHAVLANAQVAFSCCGATQPDGGEGNAIQGEPTLHWELVPLPGFSSHLPSPATIWGIPYPPNEFHTICASQPR